MAYSLYEQMKGFRVRNKHAKTCAMRCAMIVHNEYMAMKMEGKEAFWKGVMDEIEKIKT